MLQRLAIFPPKRPPQNHIIGKEIKTIHHSITKKAKTTETKRSTKNTFAPILLYIDGCIFSR